MAQITGKISRKYMGHFLSTDFGKGLDDVATATFVRLGKDLEEFTVDLAPDTETSKNILGETSFKHNGYEATSSADPFYAYVGDPLFEQLQTICDERIDDDRCKTVCLEVHLWDELVSGEFVAWAQECYVVPTSYGGDTSGYQIPFSVNYMGERIKGKYDATTKVFTPDTTTSGGSSAGGGAGTP